MPLSQTSPTGDSVRSLDLTDFDLRFDRYRIIQPKADLLMARSLSKYSQLAPIIYCQMEGSLVHDDGLQQIEVAQMLGRHKSWINRRLALIERLTDEAREALRLGLISPTQARHMTQLPRGNQNAVMQSATQHVLTSRELSEMVGLLLASSTQEQEKFVLEKPREAIRQSNDHYVHQWDPRLSPAGNRAAKRLGFLLDAATKMNHWLRLNGRSELQACDRPFARSSKRIASSLKLRLSASKPHLAFRLRWTGRLTISTSPKKAVAESNCSATSLVTPGVSISTSPNDKTSKRQFVNIWSTDLQHAVLGFRNALWLQAMGLPSPTP